MNSESMMALGMMAGTFAWWLGRKRALQPVSASGLSVRHKLLEGLYSSVTFRKSGPGSPQDPPAAAAEDVSTTAEGDVIEQVQTAVAGDAVRSGPGSPQDPPQGT